MEWINSNLPQVLAVAGLVALCIEIVVLGFATFILLFVGLSLLISGLAMYLEFLPHTLEAAFWANAILSGILGVALWKPLKRMQDQKESKEIHSDFAEITFVLDKDIDALEMTNYAYSGITWQVKSHTPLPKGTVVKVTKKEVGVFWVDKAR
ncbi:Putative activity regulator of membrane protease YbbK [Pseudoalteromonas luteoviolacea B = ATCC 29581]|nr:Putative activity regulator of membrane protease YbbK [Pseudoalteromonas luteoviolacea B = ATCC 29581]